MAITVRLIISVLGCIILPISGTAHAQKVIESYPDSKMERFSQKTLLKNWALSSCLAKVTNDPATKADANASAGAYHEFGNQHLEAYDALRTLAAKYAARKYGGSIESEFNTMKCIDLFHSKELDMLTSKLSKTK